MIFHTMLFRPSGSKEIYEAMLDVRAGLPTEGPDPKHQLGCEVVAVSERRDDTLVEAKGLPLTQGQQFKFLSDGPWDLRQDLERAVKEQLGSGWSTRYSHQKHA